MFFKKRKSAEAPAASENKFKGVTLNEPLTTADVETIFVSVAGALKNAGPEDTREDVPLLPLITLQDENKKYLGRRAKEFERALNAFVRDGIKNNLKEFEFLIQKQANDWEWRIIKTGPQKTHGVWEISFSLEITSPTGDGDSDAGNARSWSAY